MKGGTLNAKKVSLKLARMYETKKAGLNEAAICAPSEKQSAQTLERYDILGYEWQNEIMYNKPITHVRHLTTLKSTDIWTRIIHVRSNLFIHAQIAALSGSGKSAFASTPPLSHSYFPALANYTISLPVQAKLYAK